MDKMCQQRQETGIKQVVPSRMLKRILSLLLKTAPLTGRAPHWLMNAPREKVSAPPLARNKFHLLCL